MPAKILPPVEYLRECYRYSPEIGVLTDPDGNPVGSPNGLGGTQVMLDYVNYKAHRIIWKMMTGEEPPATIDHRDGNPFNNRWSNLRAGSRTKDKMNVRLLDKNTSGCRGVYFDAGRWRVRLSADGIRRSFGRFATREEAIAVAEATARKLFGEFYRG